LTYDRPEFTSNYRQDVPQQRDAPTPDPIHPEVTQSKTKSKRAAFWTDQLDAGHENAILAQKICQLPVGKKSSRWWTMSSRPLICPLTGFPINLLPYPPFKLRLQAHQPTPHALADGKFLALFLISSGSLVVNNRTLELSEVSAVGQYISRCKLGPFRPELAFALAKDVQSPELSESERQRAAEELSQMRSAARSELGKLRRIQEQRLQQLQQQLTSGDGISPSKTSGGCGVSSKKASPPKKFMSGGSGTSTCSGGDETDDSETTPPKLSTKLMTVDSVVLGRVSV
jgi:hypothetical protein